MHISTRSMRNYLIVPLLMTICLSGCAPRQKMDGAINVSPDTLDCLIAEIEAEKVPPCSKGVLKACEPFIR